MLVTSRHWRRWKKQRPNETAPLTFFLFSVKSECAVSAVRYLPFASSCGSKDFFFRSVFSSLPFIVVFSFGRSRWLVCAHNSTENAMTDLSVRTIYHAAPERKIFAVVIRIFAFCAMKIRTKIAYMRKRIYPCEVNAIASVCGYIRLCDGERSLICISVSVTKSGSSRCSRHRRHRKLFIAAMIQHGLKQNRQQNAQFLRIVEGFFAACAIGVWFT